MQPGEIIYKYQLKRKLGEGAFGEVWLANDQAIAKEIAIKIMDDRFAPIAALLEEARIGNRLNHPNLQKIHYADVVSYNGSDITIISQDYHAKGSIINHLNSGNFLPMPVALKCIIDVLRGLEYLHEQEILHNDIKPSNILIGSQDEGILSDYGISSFAPSQNPTTPKTNYKLHRAPEIINDKLITIQTDIYQVGITAFRLINGIGTIKELWQKLGEKEFEKLRSEGKLPRPNNYQPFVPRNLKTLLNRALNPDTDKRFQSALEMRRSFERLAYAGYWTCDESGCYIGIKGRFEYKFKSQPSSGKKSNLVTTRKNTDTGISRRVCNYCGNGLIEQDRAKMIKGLMSHVVTGN